METLPFSAGKSNAFGAQTDRVGYVQSIIGEDAVLLAWPKGKKATNRKWNHRTKKITAAYRTELNEGNIGVAVGERSNHLCSIDCDEDVFAEDLLRLNPCLKLTTRTRGRRGCNFWVRCIGSYPGTRKLTLNGANAGEWRANGAQTIISGTHPEGMDYTFLNDSPPIQIDYKTIIWPEDTKPETDSLSLHTADSAHADHTAHSSTLKQTQAVLCSPFDVLDFVPTQRHRSDRLLWKMAGRARTVEKQRGRKLTGSETSNAFNDWWELAKHHVDPAMPKSEFAAKWFKALGNRKSSDDATALSAALERARTEPLPAEAEAEYPIELEERQKQLIAVCFQLQKFSQGGRFFLASRTVEEFLQTPFRTIHSWLELLANPDGPYPVLKKIKSGSQKEHRANEYQYLPVKLP